MKFFRHIVLISLMLMILSTCGFIGSKDDAESTVSKVFELIQERDYDSALNYYSNRFFGVVSEEEWIGMLEYVNEKLGDLESYELLNWNVEKKMKPISGTFVRLVYKTQYTKYEAQENILLQQEGRGSDFRIIGHRINSPGFLKEW